MLGKPCLIVTEGQVVCGVLVAMMAGSICG